jgi:hypothetical protein
MEPTPKDFVTLRPWRVIAAELCHETSSERILELSQELDKAFAAQATPEEHEKKKAS